MDNCRRTHGLWETSAPPAPSTHELLGDTVADAIIIGAGFTGCSAALHLAVQGHRPIVLEAAEVGFGASGRNVGLVNAGMWIMPDEVTAALGEVLGERLLRQLGNAPALVFDLVARFEIECELEKAGTLHCAVGKKGFIEIAERARQWQRRGAGVQLLDAAATTRRVGSKAYSGSLFDCRAGTIQPLAYARGLARAAIGEGAVIHSRSPVRTCEDLGTVWKVGTPKGSVTAPWVIVATDAYSSVAWARVEQEQVMLPYFNVATRPLDQTLRGTILPHGEGAWDTKLILSSFRFDRAGRLIFGSVGALCGAGKSIHRDWGRRELTRLFPQLQAVDFEHEWYGMIGMTNDALPRIHRHGRNMFSVSGYNGRGIAAGTTFGRDLARLTLGEVAVEDLSLPLTGLAATSLRTAKGAFYEVGAQAAHFSGARFRSSHFSKRDT